MTVRKLLTTAMMALPLAATTVAAMQLPGTAIVLTPSLGVSMQQDDNVDYRETGAVADTSVIVNPRLDVEAALGTAGDAVALRADFRRERYASESRLDNDEYEIGLDGSKIITRGQWLEVVARAAETVDGNNGANRFGDEPDMVKRQELGLAYRYQPGSLAIRAGLDRVSYRYRRLTESGENDDLRDRDEALASLHLGYAPNPDRELFLRLAAGAVVGKSSSALASTRDADLAEWGIGYRYRKRGLIDLRAELGLYALRYDDDTLADVDEPVHLLRLEFPLTPLTTLGFTSRKRFETTRLAGSPGYQSLENTLSLNHDFGRRLRLKVYLSSGTDTFVDSEIEDQVVEQGLALDYRTGRHLSLEAGASRESRERSRVAIGTEESAVVERAVVRVGLRYEM